MKIQGTLTALDYRAAARPWLSSVCVLVVIILFIPFPIGSFLHRGSMWNPYYLYALAYLLILAPNLWIIFFPPSLEKQFLQHPELQDLRIFDLIPATLTITGAGSLTTEWRDRYRTYRVSHHLIVLKDYYGGYEIFPRRWFTDEQFAEFQTYLRSALGKPSWLW